MDPKIIDVANLAGVSVATVSRVLNDSILVKESTRRKVLQAIRELDYHPHAAAKQLRSNKTMTIGVIVPDINVSYFTEIIKGIQKSAYGHKYKIIICDMDNRSEEQEYTELLFNRTVDAMILVTTSMKDEDIVALADKGYVIGLVGHVIEHPRMVSVQTNNVDFSVEVVEHFIRQGHREIAFINGYSQAEDSYQRLEGYLKALKNANIPFRPEWIENGEFNEEGGYRAMLRLLDKKVPFTAVYAANDEMAIGVYKACAEKGLSIPTELAVAGVDNIRSGSFLRPSLTTVEQPKFEMGMLAAEKVIELLHGDNRQTNGTSQTEGDNHTYQIKAQVIIRESSVRKK